MTATSYQSYAEMRVEMKVRKMSMEPTFAYFDDLAPEMCIPRGSIRITWLETSGLSGGASRGHGGDGLFQGQVHHHSTAHVEICTFQTGM